MLVVALLKDLINPTLLGPVSIFKAYIEGLSKVALILRLNPPQTGVILSVFNVACNPGTVKVYGLV